VSADRVTAQVEAMSALVERFNRRELTITELVMKAYGMGHDDACARWKASNDAMEASLNALRAKP
jgi:hypothetical protein